MSNHTLNVYQKIGDIAKQIEDLEQKKERDFNPTDGIGLKIESKRDLDNMIKFHWVRIRFLESLLTKKRQEVIKEKENIHERLCDKCKKNGDWGCREDFFNYCFDSLIEAIL